MIRLTDRRITTAETCRQYAGHLPHRLCIFRIADNQTLVFWKGKQIWPKSNQK